MALSGTYNFAPDIGSLALAAFSRCQIKHTEISPQQMQICYLETNLLQSDWIADGITFWSVELISVPLTPDVQVYSIPQNVVTILDMYINNGYNNRLLFPFSRTDFASLGNPTQPGFPTSYWQDRLLSQTFTLWPNPDNNATYTISYYAYTQLQDANLRQGGQPAVPVWWLDAFTSGLAYRLSRHYAPALEAVRKVDAQEAYARASKQAENVPIYITPGLSSYFTN